MSLMIFTKETRTTETGKEYKVRVLGTHFWEKEDEFKHRVGLGQVFYKANKPVYENDLVKF